MDGNNKETDLSRNVTWAEFEDAFNTISIRLKDFSPD